MKTTEKDVVRILNKFKPVICTYCSKEIKAIYTKNNKLKEFTEPFEFIQPIEGKPKVFHKECFNEYLKKGI